MTNLRDGHRGGSIGRAERSVDPQLGTHHPFHLVLVGTTPSGHGRLDLVGRVEGHPAAGGRRLGHHHPGGLASLHGRAGVGLEEHPLDSHLVGPILVDQAPDLTLEVRQAAR